MPKERRDRSVSHDRYRASPLRCDSSCLRQSSPRTPKETEENIKEWEDARCSVCMEHPHNAVLLICSSHEKGCRPYMCDTSYRHSNCLDQFRRSFKEKPTVPTPQEEEVHLETRTPAIAAESTAVEGREVGVGEGSVVMYTDSAEDQERPKLKLICPLCRGEIKYWVVVKAARRFMNSKPRSCSCETCNFSGSYSDLRKHARIQHPTVRPSEADPERQRNWRRLELQRDLGDLLSTLQSSIGREEREEDGILSFDDGESFSVFFLIRVLRPRSSSPQRSSSWSGTSRARSRIGVRRQSTRLWGESYEEESGISSRDEENNQSSDDGSVSWRRRVRRRTFLDDDEP